MKPPNHIRRADPTPEQIRKLCEAIRRGWDAKRLRENEQYVPAKVHQARARDLELRPHVAG